MTASRPPDHELDALIDELTIDCYNEDEQLVGFENAFDEVGGLPCRRTPASLSRSWPSDRAPGGASS